VNLLAWRDFPGFGARLRTWQAYAMSTSVDLWVDPICPWAWMTSRWLVEVEKQRPITLNFRAMSLAHLNRNREMPPKYAAIITHGMKPVRVLAASRLEYGQMEFRALYEAMGMLFHPGGRGIDEIDNIVVEAVKNVGLPSSISDRMNDTSLDSEVIKEHDVAIALVGEDVGTPVIAVNGNAFFGPVVTPAPKGQAALDLWDGALLVSGVAGFYEIKRSRTAGPQFD